MLVPDRYRPIPARGTVTSARQVYKMPQAIRPSPVAYQEVGLEVCRGRVPGASSGPPHPRGAGGRNSSRETLPPQRIETPSTSSLVLIPSVDRSNSRLEVPEVVVP